MMSIDISGADGFLELLEKKIRTKILRKSLRAGAKPLLSAMRAEAPTLADPGRNKHRIPGQLRRKIKIRGGRKAKPGTVTLAVGVGEKDFSGETFYGGFVEGGHFTGKRLKKAKEFQGLAGKENYANASRAAGRTHVPPNAFRDRAYASASGTAMSTAAKSLESQIAEAAGT